MRQVGYSFKDISYVCKNLHIKYEVSLYESFVYVGHQHFYAEKKFGYSMLFAYHQTLWWANF